LDHLESTLLKKLLMAHQPCGLNTLMKIVTLTLEQFEKPTIYISMGAISKHFSIQKKILLFQKLQMEYILFSYKTEQHSPVRLKPPKTRVVKSIFVSVSLKFPNKKMKIPIRALMLREATIVAKRVFNINI